MLCYTCNQEIPKERLEILPHTITCVKCSTETAKIGITVWDKTTPELLIVNTDDAETLWKLERLDGRLNRLK